ncbi:unnamed protein product, partial [Trichobilharzia szidati]
MLLKKYFLRLLPSGNWSNLLACQIGKPTCLAYIHQQRVGSIQPSKLHNVDSCIETIRNVGLIAHIDAGKTTTTERMLYYA